MKEFYTVDDAADILGVKLETVAYWVRHGQLERTEQGITAASIETRQLVSDPQLDWWRKAYQQFLDTNGAGLTDHSRQQLAVVLANRVKDHGHKRGQESADALGVSRARVSQLLQQARRLYKPDL